MVRAEIIVKGEVQGVGYRELIKETAMQLELTGIAENLKDGSVKIIAEGKEETINKFLEQIEVKIYPINVEDISVSFKPEKKEFKSFRVIRGELGKETFEAISAGTVLMKKSIDQHDQMLNKQDRMLEKEDKMLDQHDKMLNKQDQMLNKQDENTSVLREFKDETKGNFNTMGTKYDKIGENIDKILADMREDRKTFLQAIDKIADVISSLKR